MSAETALTTAVIADLSAPTRPSEGDLTAARAFERWRLARAPLTPMGEQLLLAYLLDNPHWSPIAARTTAQKVDRVFRFRTGTRLSGDLLRRHITKGLKGSSHAPLPLVEPIRVEDAQQIATELDKTDAPSRVAALRAGLVLLTRTTDLNQPLERCWRRIATLALTVTAGGHQLQFSDGEHIADLTPDAAATWEQHLAILNNGQRVHARARAAANRAGIDLDAPAAGLTEAQWNWLWRALDPHLYVDIRDRAYLLVGLATARRHAELRRLDIEDTAIHERGITVRYWDGKGRRHLSYDVLHGGGPESGCSPECPACALHDLLAWVQECEGRKVGPVFATHYAGEVRRMSRQSGRLRVRRLTALISDAPWGSSRSLRAGAATSAHELGMSVQEIAEKVTRHETLDEARKYIRKAGLPGDTIQLRIGRAGD